MFLFFSREGASHWCGASSPPTSQVLAHPGLGFSILGPARGPERGWRAEWDLAPLQAAGLSTSAGGSRDAPARALLGSAAPEPAASDSAALALGSAGPVTSSEAPAAGREAPGGVLWGVLWPGDSLPVVSVSSQQRDTRGFSPPFSPYTRPPPPGSPQRPGPPETRGHGHPASPQGRRRFQSRWCERRALLTRVFFKSFYLFLKYVT